MKKLQSFTGTPNVLVNLIIASAIVLILVTLTSLIVNMAIDPSLVENARFGGL